MKLTIFNNNYDKFYQFWCLYGSVRNIRTIFGDKGDSFRVHLDKYVMYVSPVNLILLGHDSKFGMPNTIWNSIKLTL